jgi:hypothetical protein
MAGFSAAMNKHGSLQATHHTYTLGKHFNKFEPHSHYSCHHDGPQLGGIIRGFQGVGLRESQNRTHAKLGIDA